MPRALARAIRLGAGLVVAVCSTGCPDPARDQVVDSLGPEADGVPKGPLHRPGQPCLACHDGSGEPEAFSIAGTLYAYPYDSSAAPASPPMPNGVVQLVDATGAEYDVATNCVGNFYIERSAWDPTFPVWVRVFNGSNVQTMKSAIYRDGSCAACHRDPAGSASAGRVYVLSDLSVPLPGSGCR